MDKRVKDFFGGGNFFRLLAYCVIFLGSFCLLYFVRFGLFPASKEIPSFVSNFTAGCWFTLIMITVFITSGFYRKRDIPREKLAGSILKSSLLGLAVFFAISFLMQAFGVSRTVVIFSWILSVSSIILVELIRFSGRAPVYTATAEKGHAATFQKVLFMIFISASLAVVSGEILTRFIFKVTGRNICMYRQSNLVNTDFEPHPYLSYILAANRTYYNVFGKVNCSINSLGFRGEEFAIKKSPGEFRIICLGGSTTFGVQDDKHNYPYVLQELCRKYFKNRGIEVINAGVPAYSSAENLINLEFRLLDLKPDMIIINQGINDAGIRTFPETFGFQNDYSHYRTYLTMQRQGKADRILKKTSYLYAFLASFISREKNDFGYYIRRHKPKEGIIKSPWNITGAVGKPADTSAPFRRNTEIMIKLLKSLDIKILLTTEPHFSKRVEKTDRNWNMYIGQHNDIIRKISAKYGIPLADIDRSMSGNIDYFIHDGIHLTDYGAETKAGDVFKAVIENNFIR